MPRIDHNQENADFLASVNQALKKVQNKARQHANHFEQARTVHHVKVCKKTGKAGTYWQREDWKRKQGFTHDACAGLVAY